MAEVKGLLLYNALIYTMDDSLPIANSIYIQSGRVRAVSRDGDLRDQLTSVHRIDLGGRAVIPGLIDAHIHLDHYALNLQKVDCETNSKAECLDRVAQRAASTPPGEWILGHGWNQNNWEDGFGNITDLDTIAPKHPVYLTAKSLHASWVNSLALKAAHINVATPDPVGGRIGRSSSAEPDGLLFEAAMEMVTEVIPKPDLDELARAIHQAQEYLFSLGLTSVHDYDRRRCFSALQRLHQDRKLQMRVVKNIPLEDLPHASGLGLRFGFGDLVLRIGGVKIFADGALGPATAAMLNPYEGQSDNRGMLLKDAEEILEHGIHAAETGLPLTIHAIGDAANHAVLNAYTQLRAYEREHLSTTSTPLRHRIEHVQLIHPKDAARLAELDVIASMQPIHATSDMLMADKLWGARSSLAYAFQTQLQHGAVLAFGSDAPVESPNPFWGIHAAVTRRRADGSPGELGWYPEQRLRLEDALKAYTIGPAYAAGLEAHQGKLTPGYLADLVVLDADPFTCAPEYLLDIRPMGTMVGGEWVYQA